MPEYPKRIMLAADYSADPLWNEDPEDPACGCMLEIEHFPFQPETAARLRQWADRYETSNFWAPESPQWSVAEVKAFDQEGIEIWHQLRRELASICEVVFFSEELHRIYTHPDELDT